jgi:hypothetical protein
MIASPLEDKLRFVFREQVRVFDSFFFRFTTLAGEANDYVVRSRCTGAVFSLC